MEQLLSDIRACQVCAASLPHGPRPVLAVSRESRLLIIGQAPGSKVHQSGVPWDDASGKRLRDWLGLSPEAFYDVSKVGILPMGFCYPGKGRSGDLPPRPECAPLWHDRLLQLMPEVRLTLLIGQYAQAHYLGPAAAPTLTENVRDFRRHLPRLFPLPHPSPRNGFWLRRNPWFEDEVLPELRAQIAGLW